MSSAWGMSPATAPSREPGTPGAPYGTIHRVAGDGTVHGLFAACMDFCKGRMSHLRIDTHENNAVMRHLIARHGFLPCGTIYVEDGTPRLAFDWLAE